MGAAAVRLRQNGMAVYILVRRRGHKCGARFAFLIAACGHILLRTGRNASARATLRLSDACYRDKQASIWSRYLRIVILGIMDWCGCRSPAADSGIPERPASYARRFRTNAVSGIAACRGSLCPAGVVKGLARFHSDPGYIHGTVPSEVCLLQLLYFQTPGKGYEGFTSSFSQNRVGGI